MAFYYKQYITFFLLILSLLAFAQVDTDSTVADSILISTPVDSTITDSLVQDMADDSLSHLNADSTATDSVIPPPPLFDFRQEPDHFLKGLYRDSTFIIGSRYVSFGDIFDWMPGGYLYNLGSAGQLAYTSMFGGPPGEMILEYDGLNLNNPLNGFADFNLLPTESMGHAGILHSSHKPYGYMPIGQSFHFKSRTIADNPIRSQVGYRTGYYNYNDVDIRLGIKSSQKFWLDLGGVMRGYTGIRANEAYSGTKVNARVNRRFGSYWLARYVALFNLRDVEVPFPGVLRNEPDYTYPTQKDRRTDHAIILQYKDNFQTTLQYTKFENKQRASDRNVFQEQNEVRSLRSTTEYKMPLVFFQWRSGLHAWATEAKSSNWGTRGDWQTDVYSSLAGHIGPRLDWYAGIKAEKHEDYDSQLLPELNLFFAVDSTAGFSIWTNQIASYPSLLARFSTGPFAVCDVNLQPAVYQQIGFAGEKQFDRLFFHAAAAFQNRHNQVAAIYDNETVRYANIADHTTFNLDVIADYFFLPKWRLFFKGDLFTDFNEEPIITQRPNLYAKTFLQYHLVAFKGDLNARLRAGAFVLGQRNVPEPFYADYSVSTSTLSSSIYPYFHAVLYYGDAEIFLSYENYIDADVQYVYGYSMPQLWLRYGFIWHFVD